MEHIQEPARQTPVLAETDALVVGGGPGGLAAALGAARQGARVMRVVSGPGSSGARRR